MDSIFSHIVEADPDPILGTALAYRADPNPKKVNLGIGAYRGDDGKPYVFKVVRKIDKELAEANLDKEYQPIDGTEELKPVTQTLIFGEELRKKMGNRIVSMQSISGTGALRVAAEFIKKHLPNTKTVYVSQPTWSNHPNIFRASYLEAKEYPYWNEATKGLDFEGMKSTLETAEPCSAVVLHACAHNPTGVDLNASQWKEMLELCIRKKLVPILDCAYQGFASGDLDADAYAIRLFADSGIEGFVCQSFAKNMGLYGSRIGMLHIFCKNETVPGIILSQLKIVARRMYSNPPCEGARIVTKILSNPALYNEWVAELKEVSGRIIATRKLLREKLEALNTPGTWSHITDQIGMFSYTGLTVPQCIRMIDHWHIYMLKNGRISMAGINSSNIDYLAQAINEVVQHHA